MVSIIIIIAFRVVLMDCRDQMALVVRSPVCLLLVEVEVNVDADWYGFEVFHGP